MPEVEFLKTQTKHMERLRANRGNNQDCGDVVDSVWVSEQAFLCNALGCDPVETSRQIRCGVSDIHPDVFLSKACHRKKWMQLGWLHVWLKATWLHMLLSLLLARRT